MNRIKALYFIVFLIGLSTVVSAQKGVDTAINREKIVKIIYDLGGGRTGYGVEFTASRDSMTLVMDTVYSRQLHRYFNNGVLKRANTSVEWDKLIATIDLKSFDKIKSGENRRQVDGTDLHIAIVTNVRSHYHYLIVDQTNYDQIKEFIDLLKAEISSFK